MMRFVLFVLLLYGGFLAWKHVGRWVRSVRQGETSPRVPPHRTPTELVQDRECGVYVVKEKALRVRLGGGDLYFCSESCRDRYMARVKEEGKA